MNGRHFGGNRVIAYVPQGDEGFQKSNEKSHALDDEDEADDAKRLDQFGAWLEKDK